MLNNFKFTNRVNIKKNYMNDLFLITKFNKFKKYKNIEMINKIIINTTFEKINFNKKRISLILIIIEILVMQKIYKQIAKKMYVYLNIKKNSFIGCKVTLQKKNLTNFIDTLILVLPLIKNRLNTKLLNKNDFSLNFVLSQLLSYYQLSNIKQNLINKLNVSFIFSSWLLEEKIFILLSNNIPLKK